MRRRAGAVGTLRKPTPGRSATVARATFGLTLPYLYSACRIKSVVYFSVKASNATTDECIVFMLGIRNNRVSFPGIAAENTGVSLGSRAGAARERVGYIGSLLSASAREGRGDSDLWQ